MPCTASYFEREASSAALSNNYVKNELTKGGQDPKFQDALDQNRYIFLWQMLISSKLFSLHEWTQTISSVTSEDLEKIQITPGSYPDSQCKIWSESGGS